MDERWTSDGRAMDERWTSDGRAMDERWTSDGRLRTPLATPILVIINLACHFVMPQLGHLYPIYPYILRKKLCAVIVMNPEKVYIVASSLQTHKMLYPPNAALLYQTG
jgi:hypothetical protein